VAKSFDSLRDAPTLKQTKKEIRLVVAVQFKIQQ
jgi:hypothetical protein